MIYLVTGVYIQVFFICGLVLSLVLSVKYGQLGYTKVELSGPYRVGYCEFKTKELENECSVFYPAQHDGSGVKGVPFLAYGKNDLEGLGKVIDKDFAAISFFAKLISRAFLSVRVPVYKDANIVEMPMQPIVFSHGLSANRMAYSGYCMELASCGYFVITLTHNDQSAIYSPKAGFYDSQSDKFDYKIKNLQCKARENEVLALVEEIAIPEFLQTIKLEWKGKVKLTH